MEQKKIWMCNLHIGIIGSFVLIFNSCIKHDYSQNAEFYFINTTNHFITYSNGLDKYNLSPKETRIFKEDQISPRDIDASTYYTPFKVTTFDVNIRFDTLKCLLVSPSGNIGPLNIKNYVAEKIAKRTYKFIYTFTEADYNRAVACP